MSSIHKGHLQDSQAPTRRSMQESGAKSTQVGTQESGDEWEGMQWWRAGISA